jgi:hypothetical protein
MTSEWWFWLLVVAAVIVFAVIAWLWVRMSLRLIAASIRYVRRHL